MQNFSEDQHIFPTQLLSEKFHDIDLFLEHIQVQMQVDSIQLEPGTIHIESKHIMMGDVTVINYATSGAIFERYSLPTGNTLFCFTPPQWQKACVWCGISTPPDHVGIIHADTEYSCYNPSGLNVIEIMIPDTWLVQHEILNEQRFQKTQEPEQAIVPLCQQRGLRFRDMLYSLLDSPEMLDILQHDLDLSILFREWVLEELSAILTAAWQLPERKRKITSKSHFEILQATVKLIDRQLKEPLPIKELAAKLGTSPRVLQYSFQECLHVTPTKYILHRKLHAARLDLKRTGPNAGSQVARVAMLYNMNHFGRFSINYKKLFGESPSSTLKQGQR